MSSTKVTCAIIENTSREVLLAQRGPHMDLPNKWEFPGGKVRQSESPSTCLVREIKEELGIDIIVKEALPSHRHTYDHISIELLPFICSVSCHHRFKPDPFQLQELTHPEVACFGFMGLRGDGLVPPLGWRGGCSRRQIFQY